MMPVKFAILIGLAASAAQAARFDSLRDAAQRQLRDRNVPSIAIAVAQNGETMFQEAYGWADREKRIAATPHTMYSLASVSKPFTATALMILRERGRIDLDKPANDYLGDAKIKVRTGDAAALTLRRLANHTSGLPLHYQFFYEDEPYRAPSMDESILRYGNAVSAPGERYQYSNLGFGILGYVIARVSGRPYGDFLRTEVFVPLGMTRTSLNIGPGLEPYHAVRYGTNGLPIPFYVTDHPAASEIYSSAHDLMLFGGLHLKLRKGILSEASIEEMHRPAAQAEGGADYGIGWRSSRHASGHRVVCHTGGMGGVSTILCVLPDDKVSIAVLCNANNNLASEPPAPSVLLDEAIAALFPDAPRTKPAQRSVPRADPLPAGLTGEWRGLVHTYEREIPLILTVRKDGEIHAKLGRQLTALVNQAAFENGCLTGSMVGDIETADANRRPYDLQLRLKLRGDVLNGGVTADSRPGARAGNALTYWAELKR